MGCLKGKVASWTDGCGHINLDADSFGLLTEKDSNYKAWKVASPGGWWDGPIKLLPLPCLALPRGQCGKVAQSTGLLAGEGTSLPAEGRGGRHCLVQRRGPGFQAAQLGAQIAASAFHGAQRKWSHPPPSAQ